MTTRRPPCDRFTLDVLREGFAAITDEMFVSLQRTSQSPIIYEVLDFGVGIADARRRAGLAGQRHRGLPRPARRRDHRDHRAGAGSAPGRRDHRQRPLLGRRHAPLRRGASPAGVRPRRRHGPATASASRPPRATGPRSAARTLDRGPRTRPTCTPRGCSCRSCTPSARASPWPTWPRILAANSRLPDMVLGDLTAQAACLEVAERRLLEMCARFGTPTWSPPPCRSRSTAASGWPGWRWAGSRTACSRPRTAPTRTAWATARSASRVRVEITADGVVCDFTGSHPQVPGPINCTWSGPGVRGAHGIQGHHRPGRARDRRLVPAADHRLPARDDLQRRRPAPVAAYFEATEMATDLVWRAWRPRSPR